MTTSLTGFATRAQILPIHFDLAKIPKKEAPRLGQTITVDTRQPQTCGEIREAMDPGHKNPYFDKLCVRDDAHPYATLVIIQPPTEEASGVLYKLSKDQVEQTNMSRNVLILGVLAIGRIMNQGFVKANWQHPTIERYVDHITSPPVFDKDSFGTNYIEHPLSGAAYYAIARHAGFSALQSFGFSAFSSSFLWEYGLEAFFEHPSINDLIATPILGSLLGELFYQAFERIERNDGKVLGSRSVGTFVQVITNPGYFLSSGLNSLLGEDMFTEGDIGWVVYNRANRPGIMPLGPQDYSRELALRFRLKF